MERTKIDTAKTQKKEEENKYQVNNSHSFGCVDSSEKSEKSEKSILMEVIKWLLPLSLELSASRYLCHSLLALSFPLPFFCVFTFSCFIDSFLVKAEFQRKNRVRAFTLRESTAGSGRSCTSLSIIGHSSTISSTTLSTTTLPTSLVDSV